MSVATKTCIEVNCDDCGSGCWEDHDEGTPHFPSLEEALRALADSYSWTATETEQVCGTCTAARLCAAEGHQWEPWRNGARSFTGTRSRWCVRDYCQAHETEPIPSKFPQVGPR